MFFKGFKISGVDIDQSRIAQVLCTCRFELGMYMRFVIGANLNSTDHECVVGFN